VLDRNDCHESINAIRTLKEHADAIRAMGATSLYVFGSTARAAARPDSDLDLFIDYAENSRFTQL
jgi:hypothetical protein